MDDWEANYATPGNRDAEKSIESQDMEVTLANLDPASILKAKMPSFDKQVVDMTLKVWDDFSERAEIRAFGDGKASYQSLSDAITP